MAAGPRLFNPLQITGAVFKNRIIMTPLYLGYANPDGTVSSYTPERLAPSPVKTGDVVPQEMTQKDIDQVVRAFAAGAGRARAAGFDGVEIHGGTGYLIVQFLSPRTNHRTDQYGGTFQNRMRFPLEVVDTVLKEAGQDYPVGYRLLADPLWPQKAQGIAPGPIVACEPACSLCMQRTMKGKPAFCSQWDKERREAFLKRVGEAP